ncbi:hypothetical protein LPJ61_003386 [Coemansia biformis]|uniref:protein-tyrosine-phosphatase n=1 Tax=Coemansia biformis TaxID=1286918 RepID=A0A9W7YAN2_9FUNG|nr:hypothetical protein LPJ61_003386 [Coemansia biformis]
MTGPQHLPRAATAPVPRLGALAPLRPLRTRTTTPLPPGPLSLRMDGLRAGAPAAAGCASARIQQERTPPVETPLDGDEMAARRAARTYSKGPQLIMPYLYLGSERNVAAAQLRGRGVTSVVNVAQEVGRGDGGDVNVGSGHVVRYRHYRWDHGEADVARHFEECFAFIDGARQRHEGVLVHCQLGVSRSASLVIAYAMRTMDMGFATAYDYVRLRAPCISPNLSLISQLCEYGRTLDGPRRARPLLISTTVATSVAVPVPVPALAAAPAAVPELSASASSSENSSPTDTDASSMPYCDCRRPTAAATPLALPLLTPKPSATEQNPLPLHIVAHRHPLVP